MRITHANALSLHPHEWHTTERFYHRLDRSSSLILSHEEEHLVIEKSFKQSTQHNKNPHSCLILHSLVEFAQDGFRDKVCVGQELGTPRSPP